MEAILFIGVQASGKTSFFRERFSDSHVRLNLDMLRTRHRESILLAACLKAKAKFVVDNTNASRQERRRYIEAARAAKHGVIGYYFSSAIESALANNATRPGSARIPDSGVRGTYARLELPRFDEGFDELFYVRFSPDGGFIVDDWDEAAQPQDSDMQSETRDDEKNRKKDLRCDY